MKIFLLKIWQPRDANVPFSEGMQDDPKKQIVRVSTTTISNYYEIIIVISGLSLLKYGSVADKDSNGSNQ